MQRSKTARIVRCGRCRMHASRCLCDELPRLATRTRVVLVLHAAEDRKSTNTGRLATSCLANAEVVLRGRQDADEGRIAIEPGRRGVVLFPDDDAAPIASLRESAEPITLVVPDGTWRQASRARRRTPGLAELPSVSLPAGRASGYRLRTAAHEGQLATMEAIARALGVLEGAEVEEALARVFRTMVERSVAARGR